MNREKLTKILTSSRAGLADKDIVEHSASICFTGKHVVTYNDEVSVRHPLKTDFQGAVPATPLLAFLARASADEVKMEQGDGELLVKCGRPKVGIPMAADVPEHLVALKVPRKGWTDLPDGFLDAVRFCLFSASCDMTKPVLTNVHVSATHIESCDNYRATIVEGIAEMGMLEYLIPTTSAKHLGGFNPTEINMDSLSWAHFRNADAAVLSCRLFAGEYPDIGSFLDWSQKGKKIDFPDGLADALDRAGVFAVADFDTDRQVDITVKDGKMVVRAEGADGWFEEGVKAKGIKDLSFSVHPGFLQEVLKHSAEAKLTDSSLLFKGDNFIHMVSL